MAFSAHASLDLQTLLANYRSGEWTPAEVLDGVLARIEASTVKGVWIHRASREDVMAQLEQAVERQSRGIPQPLLGVPYAVKDNIDVAGQPTTAACPAYGYVPKASASVVERLNAAGAIVIGKTNLDQFATGLVGTRSPYGACTNPFDQRYIAGGSSSGSAAAVAAGHVSFSLGTDTAGSGRVPAAFTNTVGLKPTPGLLSTTGVVPACRSLDCVSFFTLNCGDARMVYDIASGFDPSDPYARRFEDLPQAGRRIPARGFRFGVPADEDLQFFGNTDAEAGYRQAVERLRESGGTPATFDLKPFLRAGSLLYDGPWLAERLAAVKDLIADCSEAFLPVTRSIIQQARRFDAVATFEGFYELQALRRQASAEWEKMDFMLLPTTGTVYTIAEVEEEPVKLNANLGYYTTFVNLMDLCALAVPNGFDPNGVPRGVSFIGPPGQEDALLSLGEKYHRTLGSYLGATGCTQPAPIEAPAHVHANGLNGSAVRAATVKLAVVGAHLSGQPLNHQLTERHGVLKRSCRTAPYYRLYALPGTMPPKPGLVRVAGQVGAAIEVEVWELSAEAFGTFVAAIPPPLGIGTVQLEDGEAVKGFVCEGYVTPGARDISSYGGWRKFVATT